MNLFPLFLGLHIISVIAWIAGLLMLARFYAYQTGSTPGGELEAKMIEASRSLRVMIAMPSMILVWTFGLALVLWHRANDWAGPILTSVPLWFWIKLVFVLILSGYQGYLQSAGRKLASGVRPHSEKFWRLMSEVPFLIAIVAVLLATLKPF